MMEVVVPSGAPSVDRDWLLNRGGKNARNNAHMFRRFIEGISYYFYGFFYSKK